MKRQLSNGSKSAVGDSSTRVVRRVNMDEIDIEDDSLDDQVHDPEIENNNKVKMNFNSNLFID